MRAVLVLFLCAASLRTSAATEQPFGLDALEGMQQLLSAQPRLAPLRSPPCCHSTHAPSIHVPQLSLQAILPQAKCQLRATCMPATYFHQAAQGAVAYYCRSHQGL